MTGLRLTTVEGAWLEGYQAVMRAGLYMCRAGHVNLVPVEHVLVAHARYDAASPWDHPTNPYRALGPVESVGVRVVVGAPDLGVGRLFLASCARPVTGSPLDGSSRRVTCYERWAAPPHLRLDYGREAEEAVAAAFHLGGVEAAVAAARLLNHRAGMALMRNSAGVVTMEGERLLPDHGLDSSA